MRKFIFSLLFVSILLIKSSSLIAQTDSVYVKGYALQGEDTTHCEILYNLRLLTRDTVVLRVNGRTLRYVAGGPVTGFYFAHNDTSYHFGAVTVSFSTGRQKYTRIRFLRKLITGKVELYEHRHNILMTQRNSGQSKSENLRDYYLGRNDMHSASLSKPGLISPFRKKKIIHYIADHSELVYRFPEKPTLDELITLLKE